MRVIFWGTPNFAVPSLNSIVEADYEVVAVVTQPDRRRNRGKALTPSPIKKRALELGLNIILPTSIRKENYIQEQLRRLNADIFIVVAFGQILPREVLDIPPLGCWNCHASLLPRWRGASPIQRSILAGDSSSGISIMSMEKGLDTGPVLTYEKIHIALRENSMDISLILSKLASKMLVESIEKIANAGLGSQEERYRKLEVIPQDKLDGEITYAKQICKDEMLINWKESAIQTHRKVMAMYPNAYTIWRSKRLKIQETEPIDKQFIDELSEEATELVYSFDSKEYNPGHILGIIPALGFVVGSSDYPILVTQGQLEGKSSCNGNILIQQMKASLGEGFSC